MKHPTATAGNPIRVGAASSLGAGDSLAPAMDHARQYTLEEATAALDWVADRLALMRAARDRLLDEDARSALAEASGTNGGGAPGRVVSEGFLALREAAAELAEAGIVLRDLDRGLVDFPTIRDDREVYLCWVESEEDEIGFWHELDAGYAGRRPL
jgi:hypothetical protein